MSSSGICGVCTNYVTVLDVRGVCAGCAPKYYAATATVSPMVDSILDATQDEQRRERRMRTHWVGGTLTWLIALIYAADAGLQASTLPWWRTLSTAATATAFLLLTYHNYVMYRLVRSRKI